MAGLVGRSASGFRVRVKCFLGGLYYYYFFYFLVPWGILMLEEEKGKASKCLLVSDMGEVSYIQCHMKKKV